MTSSTLFMAFEGVLCGRPAAQVVEEIQHSHGFSAPEVVIGAFMVDWAQEQIGPAVKADVIVEILLCLPDAVQLFTPCTLGNGWLQVLDLDCFAPTLYDRSSLRGVRVLLDAGRTAAYPAIHNWSGLPAQQLFQKRQCLIQTVRTIRYRAGELRIKTPPNCEPNSIKLHLPFPSQVASLYPQVVNFPN